ncbi:MAG TPA: hypothetical protein VD813_11120, partial [Pseudonocardia sp.]|nr:hypothetical protein [Pseudonocardia sp.]
MPDDSGAGSFDEIADELYALPPEGFVAARDEAVARARERGERELAKAVGRLRRPTRAAWLANLLARHRPEQIDGLVSLAAGLSEAQRTLDGETLRALSSQRHRLVAAMAREAGRLARVQREPVSDALLRELQGILDAALADPQVAEEVRGGRLTRAVTYSGFGLGETPSEAPVPPPPRRPRPVSPVRPADEAAGRRAERERKQAEWAARERAERERRERERAARVEALAAAEAEETAARRRQEAAEAARTAAEERLDVAHDRVTELVSALEAARHDEQAAAQGAREAAAAARAAAREAATAA